MKAFSLLIGPLLISTMALAETELPEWVQNVKVSGDFRYRHQYEEYETSSSESVDQVHRMRARLKFKFKVNDSTETVFRFTTGGAGVTSTNQTLDGNGENKDFHTDMAYINWSATETVSVYLGKMKNMTSKPKSSDIMFDSDWTPEGLAVSFKQNGIFANAGGYVLDHRKPVEAQTDSWLTNAVVGYETKGEACSYKVGLGYHAFSELEGTTATDAKGNSASQGTYDSDYKVAQLFAEMKTKRFAVPVSVFVDYIKSSVEEKNTGYIAGFKVGKNNGLFLKYSYRKVEADATFAAIADGDFAGSSNGTDHKGHVAAVGWGGFKNTVAQLKFYDNDKGIDANPNDYLKTQLEVQVKF